MNFIGNRGWALASFFLAGGVPRWDAWQAWDLPRDVVGAPFLLAMVFVLCVPNVFGLIVLAPVVKEELARLREAADGKPDPGG